MKKRNILIATLVAVLALTAVPFVFAGPGGHGRGHGFAAGHGGHGFGLLGHLGRLKEELNLSDAQVDQIKTIYKDLHTQNDAYRDQLRGGFHDVAATLLANPNDLAGAQAIIDRQAAAEKAVKANMLAATSKALNVLTAEQRGKLAELIEERSERRERRRR